MADDAIIIGSETPDADVLVYDKDVAYYEGNIVDNNNDALLINVGGTDYKIKYEYVSEA